MKVKPLLAIGLLLTFSAFALGPSNPPPSVTATWSPSPSPGITNYNVYWGGASGNYTNVVAAGTNLTVTISQISRGGTYFFAATAMAGGLESVPTPEVQATIPQVPMPGGSLVLIVH